MNNINFGLDGITADNTKISTVGKSGVGLTYRGYKIEDLAEYASFEEVAYLLLYEKLPDHQELNKFYEKLAYYREVPQSLRQILEQIPADAHPMDVLRTACSVLGTLEPETKEHDINNITIRLLAVYPGVLLYWYYFNEYDIRINTNTEAKTVAGHFLELLHGKPADPAQEKIINISLILYAEHEFNASTFVARVCASTLTDFYSTQVAAIGTLRGNLHGGANEAAMELFEKFIDPDDAIVGVKKLLADKQKIMGIGHRVYKNSDPRSDIIKKSAGAIALNDNQRKLYNIAEAIEKFMLTEKKLFPNLDFYSAIAYYCCNVPTKFFTPLFVFARTAGWSAHVKEQLQNNHLIRPLAAYIGPQDQDYIMLDNR